MKAIKIFEKLPKGNVSTVTYFKANGFIKSLHNFPRFYFEEVEKADLKPEHVVCKKAVKKGYVCEFFKKDKSNALVQITLEEYRQCEKAGIEVKKAKRVLYEQVDRKRSVSFDGADYEFYQCKFENRTDGYRVIDLKPELWGHIGISAEQYSYATAKEKFYKVSGGGLVEISESENNSLFEEMKAEVAK